MEALKRNFDPEIVKKEYAKVLWIYDIWGWLTETKAAERVIELCDIKDGIKILEVAVGTGKVFEKIVGYNPGGTNIGIDLSPEMLKRSEKILRKRHLKNFELREGNALNLEFPDESFNILVNNFMIDLMPAEYFDRIALEFHRLLKPGGIAVISTFSFGYKRVHKLWQKIAEKFPGVLTGCRPVSIKENLVTAGFLIENDEQISQNSFPAEIIKARKQIIGNKY
jgi:ubiquinone/menaquinone biosynthesis C-methylase UbiE